MIWHYSNDGQQFGPVSEADFQAAVASGVIHANTLVWRQEFANWIRYSELSQPQSPNTETTCQCKECGGTFAKNEMVSFSGNWICAGCKPLYVQKLKEGAQISNEMPYAGFGIRFGAKFVDGIILSLVRVALNFAFMGGIHSPNELIAISILFMAVNGMIATAYQVFFLGAYGATPGKMLAKIKVVRADGSPLTYGRAFGRVMAEIVSYIILGIGYLMVIWDPEKRSLHDRMCDTRVIKTNP